MNKLFEVFPKPSKQEWIDLLTKELKGANFEKSLIKKDEIEGIKYPSFYHNSDLEAKSEFSGLCSFKRGFSTEINDWSIVGEVLVSDEKSANKKALDLLMKGNTALHFEFEKTTQIDWNTLFAEIELKYIELYFSVKNEELLTGLSAYFSQHEALEIFLNYNPLTERNKLRTSDLFPFDNAKTRHFEIDAYSIQQAGANCSQEIAFALSLGHAYLFEQIQLGRSADEASENIHFTFGIGSNFLFEIAKLRAFRLLWASILETYQVNHKTSSLTSKTGFLNKSLKDPFTNLLRQTTEVMSAVLGGSRHIINQAYDKESTQGASEFSERMATNISLILKEESYLNQVLDAVGGSYAIESFTEAIANQAWSLFQENEKENTIVSDKLKSAILKTAHKRIALIQDQKHILIGVNKFPNPDSIDLKWKSDTETYFGFNKLVLEQRIS